MIPSGRALPRAGEVLDRVGRLTASEISVADLKGSALSPSLKAVAESLVKALCNCFPEQDLKEELEHLTALPTGENKDSSELWAVLASVDAALEGKQVGGAVKQLDRIDVLERLVGKLQAQQLLDLRRQGGASWDVGKPDMAKPQEETAGRSNGDASSASDTSQLLREVALQAGVPVSETAEGQLESICRRLDGLQAGSGQPNPPDLEPLLPMDRFDASQIEMLQHIFAEMQKEYGVRRQMLIERAKVTLQSMLWSKELLDSRGTTEQAAAAAENGKARLVADPQVQFEDVFRAHRGDVAAVTGKVSGGVPGKAQATVKLLLIGQVPDRGGRPTEGRSAVGAASMPAWAPRTSGGKADGQGASSGAGGRRGHPRGNAGSGCRGRRGRGRV